MLLICQFGPPFGSLFRPPLPTIECMKTVIDAFTKHPATVNESYAEHLATAWSFAFQMIGGGCACLLHGLLPFLFTTTGSSTIRELHERMVTNRVRQKNEVPAGSL